MNSKFLHIAFFFLFGLFVMKSGYDIIESLLDRDQLSYYDIGDCDEGEEDKEEKEEKEEKLTSDDFLLSFDITTSSHLIQQTSYELIELNRGYSSVFLRPPRTI